MESIVFNEDCMAVMKRYPDKWFDLAVVDPPYGIGFSSKKQSNFGKGGINHEYKGWDEEIPKAEYWSELFRVSKNQIVWGGNYMTQYLKPKPCWLIWDKMQEFSGAVFELAWTSFDSPAKAFRMSRVQAYANQNKVHPTQKPIALYKWLLKNYAQQGDHILDTHMGSQSSRIACHDMGFDFTGYEIDKEYFDQGNKRFNSHIQQQSLFNAKEMY